MKPENALNIWENAYFRAIPPFLISPHKSIMHSIIQTVCVICVLLDRSILPFLSRQILISHANNCLFRDCRTLSNKLASSLTDKRRTTTKFHA